MAVRAVGVDCFASHETRVMRGQEHQDVRNVGGLGMLLHQAVPGFERWFGRRPEVTAALQRHVAADIPARLG